MSEGIAYQNKDILFKILGQTYKEKSFAAYGIDLPPIKELLPTSLPKISANEKDIDNLFLLEDGTYAIVDYESEFKKLNKIKYLNYIARVMEKYYKEDETFNLRFIVIYTGDVKSAEPVYETSCFTLRMEQAFLSHIDGETAFESISQKLRSNTPLEDDDLMKLVILPLTMPGIEGKQKMLEKVVDLAEQVTDSRQQIFILSGVIVASDKFINREYLEQIRRRINMTQLGQLYEKEKIEYANKKNRELTVEMAKSMLDEGIDFVKIMKVTGLTEDELLRLQDDNSQCICIRRRLFLKEHKIRVQILAESIVDCIFLRLRQGRTNSHKYWNPSLNLRLRQKLPQISRKQVFLAGNVSGNEDLSMCLLKRTSDYPERIDNGFQPLHTVFFAKSPRKSLFYHQKLWAEFLRGLE